MRTEKSSGGRRLVTFLGTGPEGGYSEVIYCWNTKEGAEKKQSSFVARALVDWVKREPVRPITEMLVLGTDKSFEINGSKLDSAMAEVGLKPKRVLVPSGASPEELWELFEVTKEALRFPGGEVLMDITHGFRTQPFFAAAVLFFLRAVDDDMSPCEVVYGADANKTEDGTKIFEIWELTSFVELVDWALGLQMFLKTGRADEIAASTKELGRSLQKNWYLNGKQGDKPELEILGKVLDKFSADFQTVRTGALLLGNKGGEATARTLLSAVKGVEKQVKLSCPPMADVLPQISSMIEGLQTDDLQSDDGHRALVHLAKLYIQLGRYSEASTTLREAWVTRYSVPAAGVPGLPEYDAQARTSAERRWLSIQEDEAKDVSNYRNTLAHGGYSGNPTSSSKIKKGLERLIGILEEKGGEVSPAQEIPSSEAIFINLSNHPSADWPDAQKEAAIAMAPNLQDVTFPDVDPAATGESIMKLAKTITKELPEHATYAMVMGEHSLIVPLVLGLKSRGIRCYAATTQRDVKEVDGIKQSRYEFVAFREYMAEPPNEED